MRPKVYITRQIPDSALSRIREKCEMRIWDEDRPVPRDILTKELMEADGLYCLLTDTVDRELLVHAQRLKVVSNMAVGYNNIDVDAATSERILVTNTPGVLNETTADLTFALLLASARRLVEASDYLRSGSWNTWSPMLLTGQDVHGATLGIVGLGRIGEAIAKRARGFDMRLLYHSRSRKPGAEKELGLEYCNLETLLREADFVCLMTPLTSDTKHLIGEKELSLMKKRAVLINTARGGILDEAALYRALADGVIWGAGLDVFEEEPVPSDHPLLSLPNVTVLPHIGSASISTRIKMAEIAADNLLSALCNEIPANLVNPKVVENRK
jgi:glyoxylate reductase